MEQEPKKVNKSMFWVGLILIIITAAALLFVEKDLGAWPIFMGVLGIVAIGASKYRPVK